MESQQNISRLWNNVCMESFGQQLRELRKEKHLGQVQLAKEIDVGKSIVNLWETDTCEPTLSNLVSLAEYFGVTIDYLAGLED